MQLANIRKSVYGCKDHILFTVNICVAAADDGKPLRSVGDFPVRGRIGILSGQGDCWYELAAAGDVLSRRQKHRAETDLVVSEIRDFVLPVLAQFNYPVDVENFYRNR